MQGFLNISHNFAGESQFIVVDWVRSNAQGTPVPGLVTGTNLGAQDGTVQTQVFYPAAHSNEQLQITELPEMWFLVRFWRSVDGVSKDVLLLELAGNARTGAVYPITRYEYVVDRGSSDPGVWSDPVSGTIELRDTRLLDQNYWVEERGTGSFITGEIVDRSDAGGGFDLAVDDKTFNEGGVYVVYVIAKVDLPGDDSGLTSDEDILILDADQDYDQITMAGKILLSDFPGDVGILTMPNLALLADQKFTLDTNFGAQRNVVVQLDTGDTVRFMGAEVNKIVLGQNESVDFVIKNNVLYAVRTNTGHENLSKVVWGYKQLPNTLFADGVSLLLANYPRVEELIDSLPASSVVDQTTWDTTQSIDGQTVFVNRGKWMRDGLNFRTPDLRDRMLKALTVVDGSVASGRYEHQKLLDHGHGIASNNDNGGSPNMSGAHSTGGNLGYDLNGSSGPVNEFRSGGAVALATGTAVGDSTNQKVNNIGLYPLICI